MPNFMDVSWDPISMTKFKNRFAERKQAAVMNSVKSAESAGAVILLNAILQQIDAVGLVDTGRYRSSWMISTGPGYAKVYTKHPAAHRHEYGFFGRDSLGRMYQQSARPHVRPAIAMTRKQIANGINANIVEELRK